MVVPETPGVEGSSPRAGLRPASAAQRLPTLSGQTGSTLRARPRARGDQQTTDSQQLGVSNDLVPDGFDPPLVLRMVTKLSEVLRDERRFRPINQAEGLHKRSHKRIYAENLPTRKELFVVLQVESTCQPGEFPPFAPPRRLSEDISNPTEGEAET